MPVFMQRIAVRITVSGNAPQVLDGRTLRSLKTTVTTASGAGQAGVDLFLPHTATWVWKVRSMDGITLDAAVVNRPGSLNESDWSTIFTGVITDNAIAEAADTGLHLPLTCASMYHLLEATTETPEQFQYREKIANMPISAFMVYAAGQAGLPPFDIEEGIDAGFGIVPQAAIDPVGYVVNPQYMDWASVVASLAKIAGRELWCNEIGRIQYRPSHYADASSGPIPTHLLLNVQNSIDTDKGLINRVSVRYSTFESFQIAATEPAVGSDIQGYDRAHYHERLLIVPAPWIHTPSDADWLARWVLSWGASNTRPAVVTVNFWPQVRVGEVYTLEWPAGKKEDFYVSSVVHQVTSGGPAVTVLGLTYGRPPGFKWNIPTAPGNYGNSAITVPAGVGGVITADNWKTTVYTPKDPRQPALRMYGPDPQYGPYLISSDGAQYFQSGWRQGSSGPLYDYSVRPCGYAHGYQIPELGGVTLSTGDRARLANGVVVMMEDTGGDIIDRQFDTFYWQSPGPDGNYTYPTDMGYGGFQTVQFLHVRNYPGQLPDIPPVYLVPQGTPTPGGPPPIPGPPVTGGPGDPGLASLAFDIATHSLLLYGGLWCDAGPHSGSTAAFADFCDTGGNGVLGNGDGYATCVLFVRWCLLNAGAPSAPFGNGNDAGNLAAQGFLPVAGQLPLPGDVSYWDSPQPASNGGNGHVAIVVSVTAPVGGIAGFVEIAQANCPSRVQNYPLTVQGSTYTIGSVAGIGPWIGLMRPPTAGA